MSEAIDASRGDFDDPLAGPTYIIGVVGTVILIATVLLVQKMSHDAAKRGEEAAAQRDYFEITNMREEQNLQLIENTWTFPEEERVSVPIPVGIEEVLRNYGSGQ